ncbi:sphingosine-1-phosphate phosphatase 2 [Engraulis encrasicolus]|uniref:sphingosine-1-phosphate phosphatase 2 n=1 Tax=Engraulis encrasicolus TaxID=184585 RepID=UPI002FCF1D4D
MWRIVEHLHSSELVAQFQRACGLFPVTATEKTPARDESEPPPSNGHVGLVVNRHQSRRSEENSSKPNQGTRQQDNNSNYTCTKNDGAPDYVSRRPVLHLLFLCSSALGSELLYISLVPCIQWSIDPFLCRRLVNMWAVVMYIGQVLKDVLKLPRPLSPPVVKLEKRVDAEYGLPSTHAMAAIGITYTLLLSAPQRIQFQWGVGVFVATLLSSLVCLSRIYTGMHSALDVICGALLSAAILVVSYPAWAWFDWVQLHWAYTPVPALVLPAVLSGLYPELDHYSPTRGDTATIMGVASGCWLGYWLNERVGWSFEPVHLPMPFPPLTPAACLRGVSRAAVGLPALLLARQVMRRASLEVLCRYYGASPSDQQARRRRAIEVPSKFVTYAAVGVTNSLVVNRLLVLVGVL